MVSVFTGLGSGFERGSLAQLGSSGLIGSGAQGRDGSQVSINAANGNVIITRQDEFLVGRGADASVTRTYNSDGTLEENGDHWRFNWDQRIIGVSQPTNTAGATATKLSADGSEITYIYESINGETAYWATDGSGAHDKLIYETGKFTWTDGETGIQETYLGIGGYWRLYDRIDQDGNTLRHTYDSSGRLNQIKTSNGDRIVYSWSGNNISYIRTYYMDFSTNTEKSLTGVHYTYDSEGRLWRVWEDRTPDDHSIADGNAYGTTYTYHGTTNLVKSVTQSDGSKLELDYDGQGRIALVRQWVTDTEYRDTMVGYGDHVTAVTGPDGSVTQLFYDDKGQLIQVIMPPDVDGGESRIVQYEYDADGNIKRTITTSGTMATAPQNLVDASDWGGGLQAERSENLIADSGWPQDVDVVPTGDATVDSWNNAYSYRQEAEWVRTAGPYGDDIISMHAGQIDTDGPGGGAVTNGFEVDTSKSYEFTYYFKADALGKHRTYFGLYANGGVRYSHSDSTTTNPYFSHFIPGATTGYTDLQAGKWYKVIGYVLPEDSPTEAYGARGGIYDTGSGEKISNITNFRWLASNEGHNVSSRFFNHYETQHQGKYTHFYKPEVREISNFGILSGDQKLDIERDEALFSAPTVAGWSNHSQYVTDHEARWVETIGPNGNRVVALETGQFDGSANGGGAHTNNFTVDPTKTYRFTQYVRKTDLSRHYLYFGLTTDYAMPRVDYANDGTVAKNPYFLSMNDTYQRSNIQEDGWYKIVGYVLPEGTPNQPLWSLGGVFDAETGEKVYNARAFRWNADNTNHNIQARFFGYYDELEYGWSTQWLAPEVVEVSDNDWAADNLKSAGTGFGIRYDETGGITEYAYDTRGNTTRKTDPSGVSTYYTYDTNNNLTRIQKLGSQDNSTNAWQYKRYVYDSNNRLRFAISAEGHVTEYRYQGTTAGTYGQNGDLRYTLNYTTQAYAIGSTVPTVSQMESWTSGIDKSHIQLFEHRYDAKGNVFQTVDWSSTNGAGTAIAGEGYKYTIYTHDTAGRILSKRVSGLTTQHFAYDGMGRMISTTDQNGGVTSITFNDAATTTVITSAGGSVTTNTYNKAGDLISVATSGSHVNDGTVHYEHDRNGQVRIVTSATGGKTYYVYDNAGNVTAEVDHSGFVQEYRYDTSGRQIAHARYTRYKASAERSAMLVELSDPNNTLTAADLRYSADQATNHHSYDIWEWTAYDDNGRVSRTVLGDGSVTAYTYDKGGRLVKTHTYVNKLSSSQLTNLRAGTVDADAYFPTANSAKDRIIRTFYDRDGRVIGTLDGEGYLTKSTYDQSGRLIQESVYANPTSTVNRASGTYAELFNSVSKSSAKDAHTRYVYDGQGLLRFTIDARGKVTENVYRGSNNTSTNGVVRRVIQHTATLGSLSNYNLSTVKAAVAALGSTGTNRSSWAVYNTRNQLMYAIDATGAVTGFKYDAMGNVTKTTQYAVSRSTTSLPTEATMNSWAGSNSANARITRSYYNQAGQMRFTIDGEGYVTRVDYDKNGRKYDVFRFTQKVSATDSWTIDTVNSQRNTSNASYVRTAYRYQANGALSSVYDGNNTRRYFSYYANGTQAWEVRAYGTDQESWFLHGYDAAGRKYFDRQYMGDQNNANHEDYNKYRQTLYYYDGLGNMTRAREHRGNHDTTTLDQNTYFEYDRAGNLTKQTDAEGGVSQFEYNAFNQVVKSTDPRGNHSYTYYDEGGRVKTTVNAENYVVKTTYNSFGEVKDVTRFYNRATGVGNVNTEPSVAAHALDSKTSFTYDDLGRLTRTTDDFGNYEEYTLDAFGHRTTVRNKAGGLTHYTYDDRGLVIEERVVATAYNSAGTVTASEIKTTYDYDSRGNRIRMIEAVGLAEERVTSFIYDDADRLIKKVFGNTLELASELGITQTDVDATKVNVYDSDIDASASATVPFETYAYDKRGNMIESTNALGARTLYYYDKLDRVTHQISAEGTLTRNFYDANNNLVEVRVYGAIVPVANRIAGTTPPADPSSDYRVTTFTYDRLGRMTESKVPNIATGEMGSSFGTATSDLITAYEYDANGNVIKQTDPNGNSVYMYYDKLGRKTRQVDADGYLTRWEYDVDGNVKRQWRYAQKPTGTITTSSWGTAIDNWTNGTANTATQLNMLATHGFVDRVTEFEYNKAGRRTLERRQNVLTHGSPGEYSVYDVNIQFAYNALGQVITRTEATGDKITYSYDAQGRMTSEKRTANGLSYAYTDRNGNNVTPQVNYYYNGLNLLTRSLNNGTNGVISHAYSKFNYGEGGRLESQRDAEGNVRYFRYDAVGQLLREQYIRSQGDGTTIEEAKAYEYDLEGRVVAQGVAIKSGSTWSRGGTANDYVTTEYNTFGEVKARGFNGVNKETFEYDKAGRVWKTTSGDGIAKIFMYDKNGNQTLSITSTGTDLSGYNTISSALNLWGSNRASIGTTYKSGVVATLTKYDGRNMAVEVLEPQRETKAGAARSNWATSRDYNAFGDVISETDARGNTIDYTYNTMGRRIKVESPSVSVTHANGSVQNLRPTEYFYYDKSGRLVAWKDANGHLTRQDLLAGTGYDGAEALVTKVTAADGGIVETIYDRHGNATKTIDQLGRATTQTFDRLGRVKTITHASGLVDTYEYDIHGQQIKHWNNQADYENAGFYSSSSFVYGTQTAGSSLVERTNYDAQGRVIRHVARGGDTTTTSYAWQVFSTPGTGQSFGGWQEVTTYENGKTLTEKSDVFGRMVYQNNVGGKTTNYNYNDAGQLVSQSGTGSLTTSYTYLNTGRLSTMSTDDVVDRHAVYGYDKSGNLTSEYITLNGGVIRNGTASYDALGRMTAWNEANAAAPASINFAYDANGNIRKTEKTFHYVRDNQTTWTTGTPTTDWFAYDSMNRLTTDKGDLVSGTIVRGLGGTDIAYDLAGQRAYTLTDFNDIHYTNIVQGPGGGVRDPDAGDNQTGEQIHFVNSRKETYTYDNAGRLDQVQIAEGYLNWNPLNDPGIVVEPTGSGALRADFTYDLMGRTTRQLEYDGNGTASANITFDRNLYYNAKSQVFQDKQSRKQGGTTKVANSFFFFRGEDVNWSGPTPWVNHNTGNDAEYALGQVTRAWTFNHEISGGTQTNHNPSESEYSYTWYDAAQVYQTKHYEDVHNRGASDTDTTTHYRDKAGTLDRAYITDGRTRNVYYTTDIAGQVTNRREQDSQSTGDPREIFYRFGGKEMGRVGNNGHTNMDYNESAAERTLTPGTGPFRNGSNTGRTLVDFDNSYQAINSYNQGSAAGTYQVRAGDTLTGIAAAIYGDSSLWYKIAQVNGVSSPDAALIEGQSLTLPAGVTRNTYNANTFKPYNAAEAIGDTAPTAPEPPKKNKNCGALGVILVVIVAVAVTVITKDLNLGAQIFKAGLAAGSKTAAIAASATTAASAAAAASAASQGAAIAVGIQDKFSWSRMATDALKAGFTAGLSTAAGAASSAAGTSIRSTNDAIKEFARAARSNVLKQGLGLATGLQKRFSWSGVAAAGIGKVTGSLVSQSGTFDGVSSDALRQDLVSGAASLAQAATRSAIDGDNFGDAALNIGANIIGSAIGRGVGNGILSLIPEPKAADVNPTGKVVSDSVQREAVLGAVAGGASNPVEDEVVAYGVRQSNGLYSFDISSLMRRTSNRINRDVYRRLSSEVIIEDYDSLTTYLSANSMGTSIFDSIPKLTDQIKVNSHGIDTVYEVGSIDRRTAFLEFNPIGQFIGDRGIDLINRGRLQRNAGLDNQALVTQALGVGKYILDASIVTGIPGGLRGVAANSPRIGGTVAVSSIDNLFVGSLDELTDLTISPALARSTLIGKGVISGNNASDKITLATASVRTENGIQYFISASGRRLNGLGDTIEIGGKTFNIIKYNSGTIKPVVNPRNSLGTIGHAEAKLFSALTDKFGGKNVAVTLAVQNNSKAFAGFCGGCRQTVDDFASLNTSFKINAFQGSTKANFDYTFKYVDFK